ncbi:MAG: hypothetical protein RLN70_04965, partial [Rhodospirillaceae bacterium]
MNLLLALLRDWAESPEIDAVFAGSQANTGRVREEITNVEIAPFAEQFADASRENIDIDLSAFDAVFTATSMEHGIELALLHAARRQHVPTFSICDMWWAYEER